MARCSKSVLFFLISTNTYWLTSARVRIKPSARLPGRCKCRAGSSRLKFHADFVKKNVVQAVAEDPWIEFEERLPIGLGYAHLL